MGSIRSKLCLLALALLTPTAFADVKDGETYKCGTQGNVTFSVSPVGTTGDVSVSITHDGHSSPSVTGTPGAAASTCSAAPEMTPTDGDPNTTDDGPTVRIHNGKAQYKNSNGDWIDCGAPRKKDKKRGTPSANYVTAGSPVPCDGVLRANGQPVLPLLTGDIAPWDGYYFPGDDVTSLP